MEMDTSNVKVSKHIPDDIAFSILSKLPIKSFKRFQCVRKSWSLLFHNPYFMKMYRNNFLTNNRSYYNDTSLLLHLTTHQGYLAKYVLYSFSGENFENRIKLNWPKPFPENNEDVPLLFQVDEDGSGFDIMGSVVSINGILCLRGFYSGKVKLILWNPTTNKFKFVPSSPDIFEPYRWYVKAYYQLVGYDRVKDDYKVIQFTTCTPHDLHESAVSFSEIYSLRNNSWRKIGINMPRSCIRNDKVYMDGVYHWWDNSETHTDLVSFDFSSKSSFTTPVPSYMDDNSDRSIKVCRQLVILNGYIALILNYTDTSTFHISILGELGVKESWTKLFIIGPLPCLEYPVGAGKKGKILFRRKDHELVWFDLNTGMIDEIGITTTERCNILYHKESILPIG
jgi:molecular chaperone HtpG